MSSQIFSGIEKELLSKFESRPHQTKVGFEKESLRIHNGNISRNPHPENLGSALCNSFITTDFSEAQLELVTPPLDEKKKAIKFLDNIHHFISHNIDDETIWPFSMPNRIESEDEILIASYGKSNSAQFKELYRKGLSQRYGKMMQAISGFHFNYSVSPSFWEDNYSKSIHQAIKDKDSISSFYLNMLRNIHRFNWIILYLFGASPVATKYFISGEDQSFKKLDKDTIYLPHATSLRMSSYGYQNKRRKRLKVSLNSINEYISDLRNATSTHHPEFSKPEFDHQNQINDYVLQIDDEYYAIARAKSAINTELRTTSKLKNGGIDFIELRSLDLNPFSRVGIDEEDMRFLEVFLAYCFIKQNECFDEKEIKKIEHNDELVATRGRKPGLKIIRNDKEISLKDWGNLLIDELFPIAAILDTQGHQYSKAIKKAKEEINNPCETLSNKFLDIVSSGGTTFIDYGLELSEKNKEYYLKIDKSENEHWDMLETMAKDSIKLKNDMEKSDSVSLESYILNYFQQ